ncbi:gag protein [Pochonia chlamydosporia 170]|uniref:Gag protein n=1 Tax=Pochonia chlamydosporia 170 TaxID=1380566 RepID=A0A219ANJ9_METCM|nr:gag protein [Pochonia chlamydosporia 170]OWT42406.1 gag protein [Pochonia chlamydosporia 170]
MASTENAKGTTRLRSSKDWEVWSDKFMMKAIDLNVWSLVDPDSDDEPIAQPRPPEFSDYPRRVVPSATAGSTPSGLRSSARQRRSSQLRGSETLDDEIEVAPEPDSDTEWAHNTLRARGYHELVARDRDIYDRAGKDYDRRYQAFKDQQAALSKLRTWVMDTITDHYYTTCCKGESSIRAWLRNLKEDANVDAKRLRSDARERYRAVLKPLAAPPSDFETWINQWKEAFAYARSKDVSDVQHADEWLDDLVQAVRKIMPNWGSTFRGDHRHELDENDLSYHEVAASLREEARDLRILKKTTGRVSKGAFGPTFGTDPDQCSDESADQVDGQKGKSKTIHEKEQKTDRRKRSRTLADDATCQACGSKFHNLSKCYYINQSIAPRSFKGNPTIRLGIEARLLKDTAFAEEVRRHTKPKEEDKEKQL